MSRLNEPTGEEALEGPVTGVVGIRVAPLQ